MSIVKKLMTIASDMQRVYDAGYAEGAENGGIKPSGYVTITENGTYDVTPYAQALVVVPDSGGGGGLDEAYVEKMLDDAIAEQYTIISGGGGS